MCETNKSPATKALSTIALFYLHCQTRTVAMDFDKASDRVDWKINQLVKPRSKPG